VKDAVKSSKTEIELLHQQVNDAHMLLPSGNPNRTSGAPDEDTDGSFDESELPRLAGWVDVAAATSMPQPQYRAIRPHQQLGLPIVGVY
jgi:hypothetical protein